MYVSVIWTKSLKSVIRNEYSNYVKDFTVLESSKQLYYLCGSIKFVVIITLAKFTSIFCLCMYMYFFAHRVYVGMAVCIGCTLFSVGLK
jgi:hypothetical protein